MAHSKQTKTNNPFAAFYVELKRRRVLKIGGGYIAGAWLGAEIIGFLFNVFQAPPWANALLAIVFVVGFPISMVLAWVIQVTEDGHWKIDPSRGDYKTLAGAITIGVLITLGLAWATLSRREPPPVYDPRPASLVVLRFTGPVSMHSDRVVVDTLYHSLMEGLKQSEELTHLVWVMAGDAPEDLVAYGRSLRVEKLVSGRFLRSAQGDQVELELLDVANGEMSWSHSYAWDVSQVPEVAEAVANGLLQAMDMQSLDEYVFRGTANREAYLAFINGEEIIGSPEPGTLAKAIELFMRAIAIDPGYTRAYVGLAQAIYNMLDKGTLPESERTELLQKARQAVGVAKKLNPDSADVISLTGLELDHRHLRTQAWERAIQLDPDHAVSYYRYAVQKRIDGDLKAAEGLIRSAVELRPGNGQYQEELTDVLRLQKLEEETIQD